MPIQHPGENRSNDLRRQIGEREPIALRTFTPTQVSIAKSAGVFHWTSDGRKLYDYTSGVLVTNLGHNPADWQKKFLGYMGWNGKVSGKGYFQAVPLTAYNAIARSGQTCKRLVATSSQARRQARTILWAPQARGDQKALGFARRRPSAT